MEDRRRSCDESPCRSSERSTPVSIEVDSPGPSRSPSPHSSAHHRPAERVSPEPRARTPLAPKPRTSTNPAPKLSFGISRILSDDEPTSRLKGSSSDALPHCSPGASAPVRALQPTDLRLHSVVVPHPLHRGLSVFVPHSQPSNGHLSPTGGDAPPAPPPAHHHPPFFSPHRLPSSSLSALDLQTISTMSMAGAGGVIKVPAHRPLNLPPGVGMSPMMFPWMQDRKDRLTGELTCQLPILAAPFMHSLSVLPVYVRLPKDELFKPVRSMSSAR